MSLKLTVNEISKIAGVSPRNIRYYDSIGLFKPSGILENGYRYFTIEKIEELRLISYLRYIGIPIKEISQHLNRRDINEYSSILEKQLLKFEEEIKHLTALKKRIEKRIHSLEYIRSLPRLEEITVKKFPTRHVLKLMQTIEDPIDWEKEMIKFENSGDMPPSLMIGDAGFIVNLKKWDSRKSTEFEGIYLLANDPFLKKSELVSSLPPGYWLTIYFKGDHHAASKKYSELMGYASEHKLTIGDFALERTLVDHFISSDPELYITEIQIPIVKMNEN